MSTVVREADVRAERSALLEVLIEELEGWADDTKFDWLYFDNPFGEARCWVLSENDDVVGVSVAFPRTLRLGTRELRAWVLGDFCVSRKLRSLGPAIKLQRAAFAAVERGDVDLCYDFPSRTMMAVYRRMGAKQYGELVRMVCLLKTDRAFEQRVGNPTLAKGLSAAGNAVLATRATLTKRDRNVEVSARNTEFDTAPNVGFQLGQGVTLRRTSDYLNWRYLENPGGAPSILSATGGGEGSIVYRTTGDVVEILDVFGAGDTRTLRELVLAVVDDARASGATAVMVCMTAEHPWMETLGEVGFGRRESGPVVIYARDGVLPDPAPCFLLQGDRDNY